MTRCRGAIFIAIWRLLCGWFIAIRWLIVGWRRKNFSRFDSLERRHVVELTNRTHKITSVCEESFKVFRLLHGSADDVDGKCWLSRENLSKNVQHVPIGKIVSLNNFPENVLYQLISPTNYFRLLFHRLIRSFKSASGVLRENENGKIFISTFPAKRCLSLQKKAT